MARRPDDGSRFALSPTTRRIAGWLVALLLIVGVAVVVGVLGGNGDGTPIDPDPSGSSGVGAASIAFGTAIDPATGEVDEAARVDRFAAGDTFAYSVEPAGDVPDAVYVEVRRTGGGPAEVAQAPVDPQRLPNPEVIAFTVPTDDLLAVFGPGDYLMLIYADPTEAPIAEGTFHLAAAASPAPSP